MEVLPFSLSNRRTDRVLLRNIEINNFIQLRSNFDYWAFTGDNAVVSDLQAATWNGWQENAIPPILSYLRPISNWVWIWIPFGKTQ